MPSLLQAVFDNGRSASPAQVIRGATIGTMALLVNLWSVQQLRKDTSDISVVLNPTLRELAAWVKDVLPSTSLLATQDAGIVPYYTGLRTLDIHSVSLVDLRIAKHGLSLDYLLGRRPDLVLVHSRGSSESGFAARAVIFKDARFQAAYCPVGFTRFGWVEDRGYLVYARRDGPVPWLSLKDLPSGVGDKSECLACNDAAIHRPCPAR